MPWPGLRKRRRKVIKARYMLLAVSLLAFPVTLNYMSPVLPLQGATERVISGSLMLFAALFSAAPFLGRLWCGWACPGGALQDLVASVNGRRPAQKADYVKYAIWVLWFGTIAFLFIRGTGPVRSNFLYMTEKGVSVDEPFKFIIYFFVSALLLIIALAVGKRGACHSVCWMAPFMICGMELGHKAGIPSLHVAIDEANCAKCGLCEKKCPMSLDPVAQALSNKAPLECINCGECVRTCRRGALSFSFGKRRAAA